MGDASHGLRDGFAELSPADKEYLGRLAAECEATKRAAEFFGLRPRRFALLPDADPAAPPPAGAKRLHLIRHGEGHHNVQRAKAFAAGGRLHAKRSNMAEAPPELHDPHLTEKGRAEATAAQETARLLRPELLVTSPLRRAVETLLLAFEAAVAAGVPAMAHELCRETYRGRDPSIYDARKSRSELAKEYPQIDFGSLVLPEEPVELEPGASASEAMAAAAGSGDPLWWHCGSPFGVCEEATGWNAAVMTENAWQFLRWTMARPERDIAIATHSQFVLVLYHGVLDPEGGSYPTVQLPHTGELRTVLVAERDSPPTTGTHLAASARLFAPEGEAAAVNGSKRPRL